MYLLDRLLIRSYLKAYVVCLFSMIGLFVVIDLFPNLDDFSHRSPGLLNTLKHIGTYYGYKSAHIFDQLCEVIAVLAATFTVAWVQRNNEMLPLLSAGVSTWRAVRPVLFAACVMLGVSAANRELVIPRMARYLLSERDDPRGEKDIAIHGAFDPAGVHVEGKFAVRKEKVVKWFDCVIFENVAGNQIHLQAVQAHYIPPGDEPRSGGWLLTGTEPREIEGWKNTALLEMIDPGKYFLHTTVDFEALTRNRTWFTFTSTSRLREELNRPDSPRLAAMAVLFHTRLTRPLLGLILVCVGLSVILRDQNRNVFLSAGLCLFLCALFFGVLVACKHLGDNEFVPPALAAWLPILLFGPLTFAMADAVHT